MLHIKNYSDTVILVVHEIYGLNRHMHDFCDVLAEQGFAVMCPNLLERKLAFDYSCEEEAYRHFMEGVGFRGALDKVKAILLDIKDVYKRIFVIGFSAGATVAWMCSEGECVDGIVGYYGSRIRNYSGLVPQCPVLLFFAQEERSFDVNELISSLQSKPIDIHTFNGKHGFSDSHNSNYDGESAERAFSIMIDFLRSMMV
ncbi:dienelactone hydrolase family protein [Peribacillus muralis]|uniref:dienelactone hydrolase family protein n=1 Tax=Peribacillus muralis TaxID=264697 RepID=UPI00070B818E|nr:dienelactone hydrolase family protein [Peribacillus muralis]